MMSDYQLMSNQSLQDIKVGLKTFTIKCNMIADLKCTNKQIAETFYKLKDSYFYSQ